jgi:bifunctional non-homologous end joining protein LigD
VGLDRYGRKRDFQRTPEPKGSVGGSPTGRLYVVQKHAARALHYDLRLELNGVLKSWAVPKGPSLDPTQKRLAVHVEDHPVAYGSFEGVIPEGEYGGGTVQLWDLGEWEPLGDPESDYRKGRLKFRLHGRKLRGTWSLARMGTRDERGDNWLLIKKEDEESLQDDRDFLDQHDLSVSSGRSLSQIASDRDLVWKEGAAVSESDAEEGRSSADPSGLKGARPARQPQKISPHLPKLVDSVPAGETWLHEVKFDGYRVICVLRGGKVRLWTRNGLDWTERFSSFLEPLSSLPVKNAIFDGEVVVLNAEGISDFQALQNVLKGVERGRLVYYLFDVVHYQGYDLSKVPLIERKTLLKNILHSPGEQSLIRYSDHIVGEGHRVFQHACRFALEGIISKRVDSSYVQKRSDSWVKVKCIRRQEFLIGGFSSPAGSRTSFGALLLGVRDDEGGKLLYAGKVGTGFNDKSLQTIGQELRERIVNESPFADPPKGREASGVTWVRPDLIAEVEFIEWTEDGRLRHPSFKGLREDKAPGEIVREKAEAGKDIKVEENPERVAGVFLTNPDRVMYPEKRVNKRDLALYYETIAPHILPFLVGRPLTVVRCPQGRGKKCFYQKHFNESVPPPVRGIAVREKEGEGLYLVIDDLYGLITLVQLGVLEFHPWGSREDRLERPDQVIFDLDPDPGVAWEDVLYCARRLRERLAALDLASYVKTSGGKGLHVVAPLTRRSEWDEVKAFSRAVSEDFARREPNRYVTTVSKAQRKGKILIDFFRNSRGATSVAPYSTRIHPGAPVSTPLYWEELSPDIGPDYYTIENLPRRLQELGNPWSDFFNQRQSITKRIHRELGF